MALALWIAFQAAGAAPVEPPTDPMPIDFDLADVPPSESARCAPGDGSEIVVCGHRRLRNEYPLAEMERLFREKPVRAEAGLGPNATGGIYVGQAEMPQGQVSNRITVGVKLKF